MNLMADDSPTFNLAQLNFNFGYGLYATKYNIGYDEKTQKTTYELKDEAIDLSDLIEMTVWQGDARDGSVSLVEFS